MSFYLSWKPGEGLAQAIQQLLPVCWCERKARKAGEVLPGAGGMRVVPSQTSKGKGSPLALRPELGFHRRSHACPQPKIGWEGSVLPPTWPPLLGTAALPNA